MSKPFVKTILPSLYGFSDPLVSVVDVCSHGIDRAWMQKHAAAEVFKYDDIKPEKNSSFLHLIAMGDAEKYSANRNGDIFFGEGRTVHFPEPKRDGPGHMKIACGTKDRCWTFEKYAKVYAHHNNKDPKKAEGEVKKAAHNDNMARVELLVRVDNDKWREPLEKIANGEEQAVSMSAKVPYDLCTICGNKAKSRKEYCEHLKKHMGKITKSGHVVSAINDHMVFFDISRVTVPADRIAYGLVKIASDDTIIGAAERAEEFGIEAPHDIDYDADALDLYKMSAALEKLKKLADIEKNIPGSIDGIVASSIPEEEDEQEDELKKLSAVRSEVMDVLGLLADKGICLSLPSFAKVVVGEKFAAIADQIADAAELQRGIFERMLKDAAVMNTVLSEPFELGSKLVRAESREIVERMVPGCSFTKEAVVRRASLAALKGSKAPKFVKQSEHENKEHNASPVAVKLSDMYARYKLAFAVRHNDDISTMLAVAQNYR